MAVPGPRCCLPLWSAGGLVFMSIFRVRLYSLTSLGWLFCLKKKNCRVDAIRMNLKSKLELIKLCA